METISSMTRIYNYATIEASRPMTGPGIVIGVIAMPTDQFKIKGNFRPWQELEAIGISLGLESKDKIPKLHSIIEEEISTKLSLSGSEEVECVNIFRALIAPRQSTVRFVARGTRYCDDDDINEMLDELYSRFVPDLSSLVRSEEPRKVDFSPPEAA